MLPGPTLLRRAPVLWWRGIGWLQTHDVPALSAYSQRTSWASARVMHGNAAAASSGAVSVAPCPARPTPAQRLPAFPAPPHLPCVLGLGRGNPACLLSVGPGFARPPCVGTGTGFESWPATTTAPCWRRAPTTRHVGSRVCARLSTHGGLSPAGMPFRWPVRVCLCVPCADLGRRVCLGAHALALIRVLLSPPPASRAQTVMLWSLPDGANVGILSGHEHVVECVAFSGAFQDADVTKRSKMAAIAVRGGGGGTLAPSACHAGFVDAVCVGRRLHEIC
jgi:hypothetical protein